MRRTPLPTLWLPPSFFSLKRRYYRGKGINSGQSFAVDDVIDPAESRFWIARMLRTCDPPVPRAGKKRQFVDTW